METWASRDGDAIVTRDNFVFYVFGYEHPEGRVFSFLKYVPSDLRPYFQVRFLKRHWKLKDVELLRPEKLYTPQSFHRFLETFRKHLPLYVYSCPLRGKELLSVPLGLIRKVYVPSECLQTLLRKKRKDRLEKLALKLAAFLSEESGVPLEDFGIHGSIALGMHDAKSDIDLSVYGSHNFRNLEKTIETLVDDGALTYICSNRLDEVRKHRGQYKGYRFAYNAVRKVEEMVARYGGNRYSPVRLITFSCEVVNDNESMFRPATYQIKDYQPLTPPSQLPEEEKPTKIVSMIGCYRNVVKRGERAKVSGMLERIENIETGEIGYQIVVGTGTCEDEYIWRFDAG
ncbi:MAG: hypothetical protein JSV29_08775 [Candidatus Bathyarchaeota archaeon]|nr:MAG: hypothetical protein JSV29_08775 [Candidatus Bathyarchaeota archaeon]